MAEERGQASVELVAALPALLLAALVALQLLAAGYALTLADGAAEAGALALASGGSAADGGRAALPGWAEDDVAVAVEGGDGDGAAAAALAAAAPSPTGSRSPARPARGRRDERRARSPTPPTVLVTAVGEAEGSRGRRAALACAGADVDLATLLVDVGGRPPRPTLLRLDRGAAGSRSGWSRTCRRPRVAARGQVCHLAVPADRRGLGGGRGGGHGRPRRARRPPPAAGAAAGRCWPSACGPEPTGVLLRADVAADRALLALVVRDLLARDLAVGVLKRRLSWVAERRALFGSLAPDAAGGLPASPAWETAVARVLRCVGWRANSANASCATRAERSCGNWIAVKSSSSPATASPSASCGRSDAATSSPPQPCRRPWPAPERSTTSASAKTSTVTSIRIRRLATGLSPERGLLDTSVVIALDEIDLSRLPAIAAISALTLPSSRPGHTRRSA